MTNKNRYLYVAISCLPALVSPSTVSAGLIGSALGYFEVALEEIGSANTIATDAFVAKSAALAANAFIYDILPGGLLTEEMLTDPDFIKSAIDTIYERRTSTGYDTAVLSDPLKVMNFAVDAAQLGDALVNVVGSARKIETLVSDLSELATSNQTEAIDLIIAASRSGVVSWSAFSAATGLSAENVEVLQAVLEDSNAGSNLESILSLAALETAQTYTQFLEEGKPTDVRRFLIQESVIDFIQENYSSFDLSRQTVYQPAYESRLIRNDWGLVQEPIGDALDEQFVSASIYTSFTIEPDATSISTQTPNQASSTVVVGSVAVDGSPQDLGNLSFESDLCRGYDCTTSMRDTLEELQNQQENTTVDDEREGALNPLLGVGDDPTEIGLVVNENDDGEPVLGNNAGTNIEIQPRGPTPEEIAAQEALEAELAAAAAEARLQEIADLEAARDSLSLTQQDAQARLQERRNRLTVLQFNELEKVTEASGLVSGRIQELRTEQGATGLSAPDQQLLLDLVAYEDKLQTEQERIAQDITAAQNAITEYETTLAQVETQLDTNAASLEGPDYSIASDYTVPNFTPGGLTDWTTYEYELPAFDPTELLTSDLANVVGHAVSVPVVGGNNRVDIDLVAEDNTILDLGIPGAITELEDESSDLLDGFTHLYFGSGVDENGDDSQWIYGEAATPEQFAQRTGTATFNGGLSGYYAHGSVSDHTLYQDGVSGSLALEVDFGTNRLTGEGEIDIDTAVRNETLAFSLDESTISETDSEFTRSLGFSANATLEGETTASGNLGGTFYGDDASEAAGSFAFDLGVGFSAGLWAAGENYDPEDGNEENGYSGAFVLGYSASSNGHGTAWREVNDIYGGEITLSGGRSGGDDGSVDIASTFTLNGYSHVSWGTWQANSTTPLPLDEYGPGYWVDVDNITASSALQNRTGTAQFGGEIIGAYVGSGNVEEDAQGIINITADFSDQSVGGQFQFGHSCSGSGLSGCTVASDILAFTEPMNDYDGSGFGDHARNSFYGVIGVFGGENGQEIGGHAWIEQNGGQYVGVFRAQEGLSFGEFVTPTTTGTNDPSDPPGTDYSNYRGLAAYNGYNFVSQDYMVGFVSVETVEPGYATPVSFENTFEGGDLTNSVDSIGRDYSYMNWGSWENADNTITEIDGQGLRGSDANWIVYDPTTNLRTTGQATYNGDAVGLTSTSEALSGNIQLTADFANDTVTGDMSLNTSNGQSWADASFDTTIRRDTDSSGFQGALTGSDVNSGVIFGGFAGPNAEEVGGGWQIDNANGTDGVGIFRAQN